MTLQEQRDVIQAALDWKLVQRRPLGSNQTWMDVHGIGPNSRFDFTHYDYRLRPEPAPPRQPREVWVNTCESALGDYAYKTERAAGQWASSTETTVHFREVLPQAPAHLTFEEWCNYILACTALSRAAADRLWRAMWKL